jgi:hypothetical protein
MKTTLMIDDAVLRLAKQRAAVQDTSVSDLVNQSLRTYLQPRTHSRVQVRAFAMPVFGATTAGSGLDPAIIAELRDDGR